MLSATDSAFDLLILQLILHASLLASGLLRLLRLCLPVHAGSENDILADRGRIERWTGGISLLETELGPCFSLRHSRVDVFLYNGGADSACGFHFLAIVVKTVGYDGFGAIFICEYLLGRKCGGVIEFFIIGPVGAGAAGSLVRPG